MPRIRLLGPDDQAVLGGVADGVFDAPFEPRWVDAFLAEDNHRIAVALSEDRVVGMATAVRYVHPDKPPQVWINEIGVAPSERGRGLGEDD